MNKREALIKYGKEMYEIIKSYDDSDDVVAYHEDDPDLIPIYLQLPEPPDWEYISGFGKNPCDQIFEPPKMPEKLVALEKRAIEVVEERGRTNKHEIVTGQRILEEYWKLMEKDRGNLKEEIEWIERQWYFRLNGYWCFIDGKPTYIDGWNYFYCGFWSIEDFGIAEYRDRDRRVFLFAKYLYTTTESFKNIDENGFAIKNKKGIYETIDLGYRTFYGVSYPKLRRDGATAKFLEILYCIITVMKGVHGGIQSFDDDNAGEHFKGKLIPAWQKMPMFFKPMWTGSYNPQKQLPFVYPSSRFGDDLKSKITYATTSHRKFYDGKKLYAHLSEEEGKTLAENIVERWEVLRPTLGGGGGSGIHGFSMHPSTVADMVEGGGESYYILNQDAAFYNRNAVTGQTDNGLARLFIDSVDGLENFIGRFGESIIGKPTPEQAKFIGRDYGAEEFIMSHRKRLLKKGDPESMIRYRQLVEMFPRSYAECFRIIGGDTGLDIEIIDSTIDRLRREDNITTTGNFKWVVDGITDPLTSKEYLAMGLHLNNIDGRVEWFPDEGGKWKQSKLLNPELSNRKFVEGGEYFPESPLFISSADPFTFLKRDEAKKAKDKSRLSKGGGAVFEERDLKVDPPDKETKDWQTYRFVCTYSNRTDDDDEFAEDMLMQCIYYGAMMYPEINIKLIWKWFVKRGYGGYLKYDVDEETGKIKDTPGFTTLEGSKQDLFNAAKKYIKHHFGRERHLDWVQECKRIKGVEFLTHFDLFTACCGCLKGSQSIYNQFTPRVEDTNPMDFENIFEQFSY